MIFRNRDARQPIGFPLFVAPNDNGELNYPNLEQSVRQSIQIILRTRPGEQLMRPGFGAGLERFAGEPNVVATRRRMRDSITESLAKWEDRIHIDHVDVRDIADKPTEIRVEIVYRLRRTGVVQSLGLTMDLGG